MGVNHLGLQMTLAELLRQVRQVAVATIQNSAIGRAGIRFYDAGKATFEGGGGIIIRDSGYIIIDGDLTGIGDFNWEGTFKALGPWQLIGAGTVTAETTEWLGDIDMSGEIRLLGDIIVLPGGRIVVGDMVIDPAEGGSVTFPGGATVQADPSGGVRMITGDAVVNAGSVASIRKGSSSVIVGSSSITINPAGSGDIDLLGTAKFSLSTIPEESGTGLPVGTLRINGSGYLRRSDGT